MTGRKYDYSIYIDGSIRITCDIKPLVYSLIDAGKTIALHNHSYIKSIHDEAAACCIWGLAERSILTEQLNFYRHEGFTDDMGHFENPVIIRKCNDDELNSIMRTWWEQIQRFTHRDQISLPYALWKNGKNGEYIFSLGNNVQRSPYFIFHGHNKTGSF